MGRVGGLYHVQHLRENAMPIAEIGDASIYYEEAGSGAPLLLIAPGGMKSAISFWSGTPWNPLETLRDSFRVIAMDQRNAGQSVAPVKGTDGWDTYTADQLGLMDHLGVDTFHVAGMCIGGPYCLGLIRQAPSRVLSATLFQSIGRDNNQAEFYAMFDDWAAPLMAERDTEASAWSSFRENMYGGDKVLFNVDEEFVKTCSTPLLVLEGNDTYHPRSTSLLIGEVAPNVEYLASWKTGPERDAAQQHCAEFLVRHTPAGGA